MNLIKMFVFLVGTALCEIVFIDVGEGSIVSLGYSLRECKEFNLHPGVRNAFVGVIENECNMLPPKTRTKRGIPLIVSGGAVLAMVLKGISETSGQNARIEAVENEEEMKELALSLKYMEDDLIDEMTLKYRKAWREFESDPSLRTFELVADIDQKQVFNSYRQKLDAKTWLSDLERLEFHTFCRNQTIITEGCGFTNPTKQFGRVKEVFAPGSFTKNGKAYSHHIIPQYALEVNGKMISATNCYTEFKFTKCEYVIEKCTLANQDKCKLEVLPTPNGVFVKNIRDFSIVASTSRYISIQRKDAFPYKEEFPPSGHILLQLDRGLAAYLNGVVVEGRSAKTNVMDVKITVHSDFTNLETDYKKVAHKLTENRQKILRESIEGRGFFAWLMEWFETNFKTIVNCLALVIVIFTLIFNCLMKRFKLETK